MGDTTGALREQYSPEERAVDESSFKMLDVDGTQVPAIPLDVASYWFQRREARFADARCEQAFSDSHIHGAVLSPSPDGLRGRDGLGLVRTVGPA